MSECKNENDEICKCSPRLIDDEYEDSSYMVRYNDLFFKAPMLPTNTQIMCDLLPEFSIMDWNSELPAPRGWLVCDGAFFDKVTYPALYDTLGSDQLPDYRGLVTGHQNDTYLSAELGSVIGSANRTLTTDNIIDHTHTYEDEYYKMDGKENETNNVVGLTLKNKTYYVRESITSVVGNAKPFSCVQQSYTASKIIKACPVREENLHTLPADPRYNLPLIPFPDIPYNPNLSSGEGYLQTDRFAPLSACASQMCLTLSGDIYDSRQYQLTRNDTEGIYEGFFGVFESDPSYGLPPETAPPITVSDVDGIAEWETELSANITIEEISGEYLSSANWSMFFDLSGLSAHPVDGMQPPIVSYADRFILSAEDFPPCPYAADWSDSFMHYDEKIIVQVTNSGVCV